MRCCAFLCASADFGVRFWYRAISFCRVSCIWYSVQASLPVVTCGRSVPCGQCRGGLPYEQVSRHLFSEEKLRGFCGKLHPHFTPSRPFLAPPGPGLAIFFRTSLRTGTSPRTAP